MKADQILSKAAAHMLDRAATYDKPEGERSMGRAVQAFNAITGRDLSEPEGWLLMQVLKDVRLFQREGYHADSAEDCVAYAALKAESMSKDETMAGAFKQVQKAWAGVIKEGADRMINKEKSAIELVSVDESGYGTFRDAGVTGEKPWYPDGRKWVEVSDCEMESPVCTSLRMSILQRYHREKQKYTSQFSHYAHKAWWDCPVDNPARIVAYTLDEHEAEEKLWYPDDRKWIEVPDDCMKSPLEYGVACTVLLQHERDTKDHSNFYDVYGDDWWTWPAGDVERIVAYTTEAPHGR